MLWTCLLDHPIRYLFTKCVPLSLTRGRGIQKPLFVVPFEMHPANSCRWALLWNKSANGKHAAVIHSSIHRTPIKPSRNLLFFLMTLIYLFIHPFFNHFSMTRSGRNSDLNHCEHSACFVSATFCSASAELRCCCDQRKRERDCSNVLICPSLTLEQNQ